MVVCLLLVGRESYAVLVVLSDIHAQQSTQYDSMHIWVRSFPQWLSFSCHLFPCIIHFFFMFLVAARAFVMVVWCVFIMSYVHIYNSLCLMRPELACSVCVFRRER